ncbi:MAG TPA: glycosyltransferase family 4 protein [Alphaproteobacteria bacterium]|nr:glycosyltransferase family 4 protein [Alphaproteobacteria bacterium]
MARLLIEAMRAGGHEVHLACRYRSREGKGDWARQLRLAELGARLAERLIARYRRRPVGERPQAWFTYHLYYKAPDHLGPRLADALGIPYLVAEASHADKRAGGPYAPGHEAAAEAIQRADALIVLNGADAEGLARLVDPMRCHRLLPFLGPEAPNPPERGKARAALARELDLPEDEVWILAVAMMRAPDKLASYLLLAEAAERLRHLRWRLILIGDGPERGAVETAFAPLGDRIAFAGLREPRDIVRFHAAADLFAWPAVNEALGMAMLEAQAAGLPVVAGRVGAVPEIVTDSRSGLLVPSGDAADFSEAMARLIEDRGLRLRLGQDAARLAAERHGFATAVQRLDAILKQAAA